MHDWKLTDQIAGKMNNEIGRKATVCSYPAFPSPPLDEVTDCRAV